MKHFIIFNFKGVAESHEVAQVPKDINLAIIGLNHCQIVSKFRIYTHFSSVFTKKMSKFNLFMLLMEAAIWQR